MCGWWINGMRGRGRKEGGKRTDAVLVGVGEGADELAEGTLGVGAAWEEIRRGR
jgi:hypothetical protein